MYSLFGGFLGLLVGVLLLRVIFAKQWNAKFNEPLPTDLHRDMMIMAASLAFLSLVTFFFI